jgi:hypothetical protein
MSVEHFFVVGAQRSGTTYLYRALDEHPEIEMAKPVRPEPKFFLKSDLSGYTHADYLRLFFDQTRTPRIRGEKSTTYIESETAARQIAQWFPDTRLIFVLREPIARAVSNYHFSRNNSLETLPIEEAFWQEEQRREQYDHSKISASPFAYLKRGRYMDYLNIYRRYFERDQMIILIYESFAGQADALRELYARLGVDDQFVPDSLHQYINRSEDKVEINLSPELIAHMRAYFADSTTALEEFLGQPLTAWVR